MANHPRRVVICSIFAQQWTPWTILSQGRHVNWVSKGLSSASIQYGLDLPSDGYFGDQAQRILTAEVARLEASQASSDSAWVFTLVSFSEYPDPFMMQTEHASRNASELETLSIRQMTEEKLI